MKKQEIDNLQQIKKWTANTFSDILLSVKFIIDSVIDLKLTGDINPDTYNNLIILKKNIENNIEHVNMLVSS